MSVITIRRPRPEDYGQLVFNFQPHIAGTLTFNTDRPLGMPLIRAELARWHKHVSRGLYSRNSANKPGLRFIGWAEKLETNPHVHVAIRMPDGYHNLIRILRLVKNEWSRAHDARSTDVQIISDPTGWGQYISKEQGWLRIDGAPDRFVFDE